MTNNGDTAWLLIGIIAVLYVFSRWLEFHRAPPDQQTVLIDSEDFTPNSWPINTALIKQNANGATDIVMVKSWEEGQSQLTFRFPIENVSKGSRLYLHATIKVLSRQRRDSTPSCSDMNKRNGGHVESGCEFRLSASVQGIGRIGGYVGQQTTEAFYVVEYPTPFGVDVVVLDFIEFPWESFNSVLRNSNNELELIWSRNNGDQSPMIGDDEWRIILATTLTHVPSPLMSWPQVRNGMVSCALAELNLNICRNNKDHNSSESAVATAAIALLQISNRGQSVSVTPIQSTKISSDVAASQARNLESGVAAAVAVATAANKITFPDLQALVGLGNDKGSLSAAMSEQLSQHCNTYGLANPPIFAFARQLPPQQQQDAFVVIPDPSYFGDSNGDNWFDIVDSETMSQGQDSSVFASAAFDSKRDSFTIPADVNSDGWGGDDNFVERLWMKCLATDGDKKQRNNNRKKQPKPFSIREACNGYKAILTLPGSPASKFTLLCNSVPLFLFLDAPRSVSGANGVNNVVVEMERWESRTNLGGLQPWKHYVPVTSSLEDSDISFDKSSTSAQHRLCNNISMAVKWVVTHPSEARYIAEQGRKFALERLNRKHVLSDFAKLLLDYAARNTSSRGRTF